MALGSPRLRYVQQQQQTRNLKPSPDLVQIWYITGPAGCGKSTVAAYIANALKIPLLEGDLFHSPENVQKMATGQPLTDEDRWEWLATLRDSAVQTHANLQTASLGAGMYPGVVVTCSALKKIYRDVLRSVDLSRFNVQVRFICLYAPEEILTGRVMSRPNHYMPATLVRSQFEALELPQKEEDDVNLVNVEGNKSEVERVALRLVEEAFTP